MNSKEPVYDIAHVGYAELLTPKAEESLWFFTEVMGMTEVERHGDSVYLRAWGDYERWSLKLTESDAAGAGVVGLRATSEAALQRRVAAIEQGEGSGEWVDGEPGRGATYRFADPDGHLFSVYYETEHYSAPVELRPTLKNQPQKIADRGMGVRRIDHVNYRCLDVAANASFMIDKLGFRLSEEIVDDDGTQAAAWLHVTQKSYDVAYGGVDAAGIPGRLHHVAYAVDSREQALRAADICLDAGIFIEAGPAKHAVQQTFFMYCWEPGGNRIEIIADSKLIFAPDNPPVSWTKAERARGQAWGTIMPETFWTYATPVAPVRAEAEVR